MPSPQRPALPLRTPRSHGPAGLAAAGAAALVLLLAWGCGGGEKAAQASGPPPPVVESVVLAAEPVENVAHFVGQLDAAESVVIKPEISGMVDQIVFEEGQPVTKGTPLVRLRDGEQRARLAEAQARLYLAKDAYDRSQRLARSDARSEAELVHARGEYEIAEAQLDLAKVELERTVIRAPFDGVMGERLVSTGERVSSGGGESMGGSDGSGGRGGGESTGVARIESLDRMELVFTVPETIATDGAKGLKVRVRVASYPGRVFPGQVFFVAPRVNEQNRRVLVKAKIPNPGHLLKPGMFAQVAMKLADYPDALMLPEDAVVYGTAGPAVWRVGPHGKAESVPVQLGLRQAGRVRVTHGLAAGDEVVVSGTQKVVAGEPVEALRRKASAVMPEPVSREGAPEPTAGGPAKAEKGAGT